MKKQPEEWLLLLFDGAKHGSFVPFLKSIMHLDTISTSSYVFQVYQ